MKILLLGKNGQVGWELQRSLAPLGDLIALDRHRDDGFSGDLSDLDELRSTIRKVKPEIIVNAAAYTAVDKAETETELADRVNVQASQVMAEEAASLNAWLIHYSTDYVFSGEGLKPWQETDNVSPVNHYGAGKLAGEQAITASGCKHLIFRTSWVYAARGNNFAKTMLRLAKDRETLNVIADQIGAPTGADLIADVTALAIRQVMQSPQLSGIYHLAAAGEVSWCGYASHVIEFARASGEVLAVTAINPIVTAAYPTPARRPLNSRLNTQKLRDNFSLHLPDWQSGVTRMLREVLNK
ncbi:dTDP-4-dehydrorhamnose reductase [Pseudomonas chlororaphis subsp. aureofaciens]|uniref:dTDP-4-dehydrorhamnose reductase n=1 Tax=Pseudomonas chlororaphis subsp. aureofaciens TaxID=587851 RepID=A0AAD1E7I5_9PSED|nr:MULTISPECIES: dTDP-4-dehydrorhamnose reductase [Pseudomonas]AIC21453.1 dTDP-4-dehydrorhamnose reductase [Pseudomonas chlororaphis]AZE31188.1 dTDP-4-dehydrorhamnose reductase [Pseudomonas chlororaphis subsp. aureofaciens]AZE37501.1 dTDP-4-dehydrorhamnose reductase [Pseudomonas chlororaphis subsp. aureofaciens]AZE43901.1 dTDP-4-dehydrorhamnose reductase [Pseudomonas chlororaphis subsp. aureofaciens]PWY48421.1 dTDP-4-dehydrorhamnose reductase [Pseudomonas sp. RW409]